MYSEYIRPILKGSWKLPALAMAGLLFALYMSISHPNADIASPDVTPPSSPFDSTVAGIGIVEPKSELVSIGVDMSGVVRELPVQAGDHVNAGDLLFSLDQREIDAEIILWKRTLVATSIQAEDAAAQFAIVSGIDDIRAIAKDDFNRRRYGKLFAIAKLEEIKAQLDQAFITKELMNVRAPIDCQVIERNVRLGEYASAGSSGTPLMIVGDVSRLHVRVEVDEENSNKIKPASEAYGMKRGDTTYRIPLSFVRFEPYIKPKMNLAVAGQRVDTRVLQVIYALPEGYEDVFVGQQMDVFINNK